MRYKTKGRERENEFKWNTKQPSRKKNQLFFTIILVLKLRRKLGKCYILSTALYGAETQTLKKIVQEYLESFKMWCCKGAEYQLHWSYEKWWSITQSQGQNEYPTYN